MLLTLNPLNSFDITQNQMILNIENNSKKSAHHSRSNSAHLAAHKDNEPDLDFKLLIKYLNKLKKYVKMKKAYKKMKQREIQ